MHTREFAKYVSKRVGLSHSDTKFVIDKTFECLADLIASGEEVHITRFGKFSYIVKAGRTISMPDRDVVVGDRGAIKFVPTEPLRQRMKEVI